MREYLDYYSNKFNKSGFNEWQIEDLFWFVGADKYFDEALPILRKYCNCINEYREIRIEEFEAETLLSLYNENDNLLVKVIISFLVSTNKDYYVKSKLVENCDEFVGLYLNNISAKDGGLASHNLEIILRWTIYKYPNHKSVLSNMLYEAIINATSDNVYFFGLSDYFIRDESLVNIFDKEQYSKILDRYYNNQPQEREIYLYADFYKDYLKYFKSKDNSLYKSLLKKYCDFVIDNMQLFDSNFKQIELQLVRDNMDSLRCYSDEDYNKLDDELARINLEQLSNLKEHIIELPKEQQQVFEQQIAKVKNEFTSLNNSDRIVRLLLYANPLSLDKLKKDYKSSKNGLIGLVSHKILDSDGRVINYGKLSEMEDFSLQSRSSIRMYLGINFDLIYNQFFNVFSCDKESENYIRTIFENNFLVENDKVEYLSGLFISFLKMDFIHSTYDIISELEESLRHYFKLKGLNILKMNGSRDVIGLSQIFNDDEENKYRKCLYEIIDEDFYFTLKWFLVDDYGFGLRNKIAHRYNSKNLYGHPYSIYVVLQILRLYWGFQK